ncbi:MAG: hypothetical protein MR627_00615 [Prevotella sp.]|nr:hypothetical protein [Prevotella sp.]MDD6394322.1 hypothetical protein [Prevotella sp.]
MQGERREAGAYTKHGKGKKIMVTNIMLAMIAMITATGAYIDNSFRK